MSETLTIRVPDGAKEQLKAEARKAGYPTLSDYLKSCFGVPHQRQIDPLTMPEKGSKSRVETGLTTDEKSAFLALCHEEGISAAQALRRQVRIAVSHGPHFCGDELLVLRDSSRQLLAIGRNLNQVVRKMHQDGLVVPDSLIENLLAYTTNLRTAFDQVSARSTQRVNP